MITTRSGIRTLGPMDLGAFLELVARDPVTNVFAEHRARTTNLDPRWLGGEIWGRFEGNELVAACHVGANMVPIQASRDDAEAFAERLGSRRRSVTTIVGPTDEVRAIWSVLGVTWGRPRELRWEQPHLMLDSAPAVAPDPLVRHTTPGDLEVVYPACVAMYTEEVGLSPEAGGGADLYRTRVNQLIAKGWSFARIEDGEVVFKAEVACATPSAAQIQGVYVPPQRRGEGIAAGGIAAVAAMVRTEIAPVASLYVNKWNHAARHAYARAGFNQVGTFSTIMF